MRSYCHFKCIPTGTQISLVHFRSRGLCQLVAGMKEWKRDSMLPFWGEKGSEDLGAQCREGRNGEENRHYCKAIS